MSLMRLIVIASAVLITGLTRAQEKGLEFAHRGGRKEFDENTLAAFRGSYEKGLRGFETDVRMTKDGTLFILHDDKLGRTFNGTGSAEEMTADDLRQLKTRKSGQPFLFLDELLAYFADKPGVYLELEMKTENPKIYTNKRLEEYCRKLHDTAMAKRPKESVYVFTSFDRRTLKTMKSLYPDADMVLISAGPCCDEIIKEAQALGVKRIGCRIEGTSRTAVQTAQKAGLKVTGWPGNSLDDYLLGRGLGLDAICTDIPVAVHTWKTEHLIPLQQKK